MKRYIIVLLAICYCILTSAASVTFKKIWLEHGVVQNGEKGLEVHVAFDISGLKNQNCTAIAYFDYPKGTGVKDTNGRYRTTDGNVCTSEKFCPGWRNTTYSDFKLFIPYSELHMLSGKHTYYTRVYIQAPSGKFLGNSDFESFVGTSSNNNNNKKYYANKNTNKRVAYLDELSNYSNFDKVPNNLGTIVSSKKEVANNGDITYTYHYDNGWKKNLYIKKCIKCLGDGKCKGYHVIVTCMMCGGTNICGACKGTGEWIYTDALNEDTGWGYSYSGEKIYFRGWTPGGSTISGSSTGNSGSSSGGSSKGSSNKSVYTKCNSCNGSGVCTACGGKKGSWQNTGYYTGDNTQSWINCGSCSGSGRCSICYGSGRL